MKIILILISAVLIQFLSSCSSKSPLTGTWNLIESDNSITNRAIEKGKINTTYTFNSDGSFTLVMTVKDRKEDYSDSRSTSGTYVFNENESVLIMTIDGHTIKNDVLIMDSDTFKLLSPENPEAFSIFKRIKE